MLPWTLLVLGSLGALGLLLGQASSLRSVALPALPRTAGAREAALPAGPPESPPSTPWAAALQGALDREASPPPEALAARLDAVLEELEQRLTSRLGWPRVAWRVALGATMLACCLSIAQRRLDLLPSLAMTGATVFVLTVFASSRLQRALEQRTQAIDREVDRLVGALPRVSSSPGRTKRGTTGTQTTRGRRRGRWRP